MNESEKVVDISGLEPFCFGWKHARTNQAMFETLAYGLCRLLSKVNRRCGAL